LQKGFKNTLVVLGHRSLKTGMPHPVQIERMKKAAQVWKRNNFTACIITGGANSCAIPESVIMRALAVKLGIPADKIIIEEKAKNIVENALFSYELLSTTDVRKLTVLTSDYQMARAKFIFRKVFAHMASLHCEASETRKPAFDLFLFSLKEKYLSLNDRILMKS